MFKNYIKIGWRNIIKGPFYSAVNIIGLSTGIAFSLLIGAYAWSELGVNTDLKNADRQYIIESKWKDPTQGFPLATLGPLGKSLKEKYPGLVTNFYRYDGVTSNISKNERSFRENIQIGDSTILEMFGFPLLYGDAKTALNAPYTTIMSSSKAIKYFGKTDVVGQTVNIESFSGTRHDFLITGVLKDLSNNSVTRLVDNYPGDFYVSAANLDFFGRNMSWQNPYIVNFIELQKGVSPEELERPIAQLMQQNAPPFAKDIKPHLVSLRNFYLNANNGLVKKMIVALLAIAFFILAMAVINFINMSITRSAARMREIGIRKVLGGLKSQLMLQFLGESILLVFIAMLIALIIYALTQNLLSAILIHPVPSLTSFPLYFILLPFVFVILLGLIAGIYPAFVLASLKSVESLKGKLSVKENVLLRKSLVGFQFGIAAIAFVGAIIISQQISLFLNNDLGYNKDYIISAQLPRDWTPAGVNKMEAIRDQLAAIPQVKNASLAYEIPDGNNSGSTSLYKQGTDSSSAITVAALNTDENYLDTYQIGLMAGSFFKGHAMDSARIVLNEAAAHALGFTNAAEAINQQLRMPGDPTTFTVNGVTSDFHFGSKQQKVTPIVFLNVQFSIIYRYMSLKLNQGNMASNIAAVEKKWSALMPGAPFEYKFMDDTLSNLYKSEIQLKKAAVTATILALIIVLLGVVGLISLSIQRRTKEIGIRKVLGSSTSGIILLFIKEFFSVIVIGGVMACPLAYFLMQYWLQGYAYRIDITALPFIISILGLGMLTALIICLQTSRAALANPAASLKTE